MAESTSRPRRGQRSMKSSGWIILRIPEILEAGPQVLPGQSRRACPAGESGQGGQQAFGAQLSENGRQGTVRQVSELLQEFPRELADGRESAGHGASHAVMPDDEGQVGFPL